MFFSIIIPTYNRAHLISKAIESVLAQTFTDWELLIIDDGSKDNTAEVVRSYADARIRYIYQDNAERSAARNNGITQSKGEFITFLDSDDYYLPERLAGLHQALLQEPDTKALFFTGLLADNGQTQVAHGKALDEQHVFDSIVQAIIHSQQVCGAREVFEAFKFDPKFRISEDAELWLRIATKYPIRFLPNLATIVVVDHDDRTVSERKNDSPGDTRQTLQYCFTPPHAGAQVSKAVQNLIFSNLYLGSARHHIYNGRRWAAIRSLLLSLWSQAKHPQTKHKLFLLQKLLTTAKVETLTTYFG